MAEANEVTSVSADRILDVRRTVIKVRGKCVGAKIATRLERDVQSV